MLWGFWPLHLWKWEDKKIGYKLISPFLFSAIVWHLIGQYYALNVLRKITCFQAQSKTEVRKLYWGQHVWPKVWGLRNSAEHSGGVCLLLLVLPEGHQLYTSSKIIFFFLSIWSPVSGKLHIQLASALHPSIASYLFSGSSCFLYGNVAFSYNLSQLNLYSSDAVDLESVLSIYFSLEAVERFMMNCKLVLRCILFFPLIY